MQPFLEKPVPVMCKYGDMTEKQLKCTTLTTVDYEWMLRELKASCLADQGTREECWTDDAT